MPSSRPPPYLVTVLVAWVAGAVGIETQVGRGKTEIAALWLDREALWGGVVGVRMVSHGEAAVVRAGGDVLNGVRHSQVPDALVLRSCCYPWADSLALASL